MRDKMSLKPMVWNRTISTGKLFDAMYTFVGMPFRHSDDAFTKKRSDAYQLCVASLRLSTADGLQPAFDKNGFLLEWGGSEFF